MIGDLLLADYREIVIGERFPAMVIALFWLLLRELDSATPQMDKLWALLDEVDYL